MQTRSALRLISSLMLSSLLIVLVIMYAITYSSLYQNHYNIGYMVNFLPHATIYFLKPELLQMTKRKRQSAQVNNLKKEVKI